VKESGGENIRKDSLHVPKMKLVVTS